MYKLLIISFAFLLTVACTKQRNAEFAQGQGENLLAVSEYNGKTFEIKTGSAIDGRAQSFSKAQQLDIKSKTIGDESFSVVSYEVNDPLAKKLLGDTPIVGKVNTTYKGLIQVEQNYLKVYKVAKAADLPLSETTYAVKLNSEELAVPLIGYPVTSRVSVDRAKNEYGEKGSTKIEKAEVNIADAKFFRVDMSRGEIFEPVMKTDVLPASYFGGEWFFSETVTSVPEEEATSLGFTGGYDTSLTPSTRIKFLSNETALKVVNLNVDERLIDKADSNFKAAMILPVAWKSYKVSSNGQGMAETEDSKIHWSKRPYLQINFDQSQSTYNNADARLVALEIKDNYISFALEDVAGRRVRYSFLRATQRNYVPKRMYKEDSRTFGFFTTRKAVVRNYEISRQEDIEKNTFISRFNPKAGQIVFNFTKTTPEWIRPNVKDAVAYWNEAFAKAGSSLKIVLDDKNDVELGDLRYNAINIIENLTASNLFGFGPSLTDPFTGEIISATTNVHLTPIREAIIRELKSYIKMKLGLLESGRNPGIAGIIDDVAQLVNEKGTASLNVLSDYLPAAKGLKMYLPDSKNPQNLRLANINFLKRDSKNPREFDLSISSGNIHAEIEDQCKELVNYVAEIKGKGVTHTEKENSILDTCSRQLVTTKFMGTLVHEMGHNFGLRHNFMASNDAANFMSTEETQTKHQVRSSSVMEYTSFNEDRLVRPGPYDIAAIRFGYADSIAMKNGQIVKLDTSKDIARNLGANASAAHSYKFCTDEDVEISTTPMCQRHDAGVTPLEVVKNTISNYQSFVQRNYVRGDGISTKHPMELAYTTAAYYFQPLMRFYVEWRSGLARYLGEDNQYLENLTDKQYEETIARLRQDPQSKDFINQYEPVAKTVFNFFYQIATTSNRYCVLQNESTRELVLNELEKVRSNIFFNASKSVTTCEEAAAAGYWKEKGLTLITEAGHFLNTFRYDLSDKSAKEPLDVIGTIGDRLNAAQLLGARLSLGYDAQFRGFAPSFMDEAPFRNSVAQWTFGRVLSGLPGAYITQQMKDKTGKEAIEKTTFQMFAAEKDMNIANFEILKRGLQIPSKPDANQTRAVPMQAFFIPASQSAALKNFAGYIQAGNGFIAANKENSMALAMIGKYNQIASKKDLQIIDVKDANTADLILSIKSSLPTTEELKTITVKDMISKMSPLYSKIASGAEKTQKEAALVLQEGAFIFQIIAQVEAMKATGKPEVMQQVEQVLALPFMQFASQQGLKSYPTAETLEQNIAKANEEAKAYLDNKVELDAQMETIFAIISSMTR